ncbi:unnamed protein product [Symbiodinium sp. CCMP2592]|nr:unnamed protein product [Symbiodinium sp. CCMP2592]
MSPKPLMPTSLEGEGDGPDYGAVAAPSAVGQRESLVNGGGVSMVGVPAESAVISEGHALGERGGQLDPVGVDVLPVPATAESLTRTSDELPVQNMAQATAVGPTPTTTNAYGPLAQPANPAPLPPMGSASTVEQVTQQVLVGGMSVSPPEELPGTPEGRASQQGGMWLFRLGEFVQRRVNQAGAIVTPLLENRQRAEDPPQPSSLTPPGSWTAASPRPRLFSASAEQQMAQWVRRAPLLYGSPPHQQPQSNSSRESLNQEQIVAEVQRQVRQQLHEHDERQQKLLTENQQLREMVGRRLRSTEKWRRVELFKYQFASKDGSLKILLDYNRVPVFLYGVLLKERRSLSIGLSTTREFFVAILLDNKVFQASLEVNRQDRELVSQGSPETAVQQLEQDLERSHIWAVQLRLALLLERFVTVRLAPL